MSNLDQLQKEVEAASTWTKNLSQTVSRAKAAYQAAVSRGADHEHVLWLRGQWDEAESRWRDALAAEIEAREALAKASE